MKQMKSSPAEVGQEPTQRSVQSGRWLQMVQALAQPKALGGVCWEAVEVNFHGLCPRGRHVATYG